MQIEESKKEINKIYRKEILELLQEFLGDLKLEITLSSLKLILDYISTRDIANSIKSAIAFMIFITLYRRINLLIIKNNNPFNIERRNRLELYINLRKELKNNFNRFEKITVEQLPVELKKLLNLRYN